MSEQNNMPDKETLMHIDKLFNDSIVAHNDMIARISMFLIRWLNRLTGPGFAVRRIFDAI